MVKRCKQRAEFFRPFCFNYEMVNFANSLFKIAFPKLSKSRIILKICFCQSFWLSKMDLGFQPYGINEDFWKNLYFLPKFWLIFVALKSYLFDDLLVEIGNVISLINKIDATSSTLCEQILFEKVFKEQELKSVMLD